MFIPSTFKRPVSSWKALNLRKTLLMASSVRLKPLNCSRLPCVYADRKSGSAGMPRPISYAVFCLKKKKKIVKQLPYVNTYQKLEIVNDTFDIQHYIFDINEGL